MANEYVINLKDVAVWDEVPENYVFIGRPSKWGNPFTHKLGRRQGYAQFMVETREEAVAKYEEWIRSNEYPRSALEELRGKVLGCYCAPLPCHGDVLLKLLRETER